MVHKSYGLASQWYGMASPWFGLGSPILAPQWFGMVDDDRDGRGGEQQGVDEGQGHQLCRERVVLCHSRQQVHFLSFEIIFSSISQFFETNF